MSEPLLVVFCMACGEWFDDDPEDNKCPGCEHTFGGPVTPMVPLLNYLRRIAVALEGNE